MMTKEELVCRRLTIDKSQYIILIAMLAVLIIEISTKKMTRIVFVKYIKTDNISTIRILSLQMSIVVVVC